MTETVVCILGAAIQVPFMLRGSVVNMVAFGACVTVSYASAYLAGRRDALEEMNSDDL